MSSKVRSNTALIVHPTAKKLDPGQEPERRFNDRLSPSLFLKAACAVSQGRLHDIEFMNVSASGCAFRVPYESNATWPAHLECLELRLYFNDESYLPVAVRVLHKHPMTEAGHRFLLFGCSMDQSAATYPVYLAFVAFLRGYAEHAMSDLSLVTNAGPLRLEASSFMNRK